MSTHIETSKLMAFLLTEQKLSEEEEGHLLHCAKCVHSMAEATRAELARASESEEPPRSDKEERKK